MPPGERLDDPGDSSLASGGVIGTLTCTRLLSVHLSARIFQRWADPRGTVPATPPGLGNLPRPLGGAVRPLVARGRLDHDGEGGGRPRAGGPAVQNGRPLGWAFRPARVVRRDARRGRGGRG